MGGGVWFPANILSETKVAIILVWKHPQCFQYDKALILEIALVLIVSMMSVCKLKFLEQS